MHVCRYVCVYVNTKTHKEVLAPQQSLIMAYDQLEYQSKINPKILYC